MSRARRTSGTTLIEVLVVIVIFLVGILAVVQVFPRGAQLLVLARNGSVARALASDEVERLKSRTDQLPEAIVATNPDGTGNADRDPSDIGPLGDEILRNGSLRRGGATVSSDWQLASGANGVRRVLGEGRRVPAPRQVGTLANDGVFGGLMLLNFGPIEYLAEEGSDDRDITSNVIVYANDLVPRTDEPGEPLSRTEYFVVNPQNAAITIRLPQALVASRYRVAFSGYFTNGAGGFEKRDVIATTELGAGTGLEDRPLASLNAATAGLASVEVGSLRVQRVYRQIASALPWGVDDAYEVKVIDPNFGVLLFHPEAFGITLERTDGTREPLQARVDYTVRDWRIIRDQFRLPAPAGGTGTMPPINHRLALGGIKVGGQTGPDGRTLSTDGIQFVEWNRFGGDDGFGNFQDGRANHVVVIDEDTGGVIAERRPADPATAPNPLIRIDKTLGVLTFTDANDDASDGMTGIVRLPDGTQRELALDNRTLRCLYMGRNEYAVQVLKPSAEYSIAYGNPGIGQYYLGGSTALGGQATRIYFPRADAGRIVRVDELNYRRADGLPRQVIGHDFVIRRSGDILPYIDIREVDANATRLDANIDGRSSGFAVRGVRGASVAVRVLWNPDQFSLVDSGTANIQRLDQWQRSYRKTTNETFLERGETIR